MAARERLTPTLFDELVADLEISGLRDTSAETPEVSREKFRYYSVPRLERFNETALRATIRRELAWLLNTTNLESLVDLEPYPEVRSSVLNFGLSDRYTWLEEDYPRMDGEPRRPLPFDQELRPKPALGVIESALATAPRRQPSLMPLRC